MSTPRLLLLGLLLLLAGNDASAAEPSKQAAPGPEIVYDPGQLPEPVARMRRAILEAAYSGEIENLLPVLQSNELMPMLARKRVPDPIAHLKEQSADGSGRDILALIAELLEGACIKLTTGDSVTFIWPYFAELPPDALSPPQQVDLYRVVPPAEVKAMREAGKYLYYTLAIGPDGTWHYFIRNQ